MVVPSVLFLMREILAQLDADRCVVSHMHVLHKYNSMEPAPFLIHLISSVVGVIQSP